MGSAKRPNSPGSRNGETFKVVVAEWRTLPRLRADGKRGAVAQLGARLNGIEKVRGSSPLSSTKAIKQGGTTEKPPSSLR